MYFVYVIQCSDGSLYTGSAKHICQRMKEHCYKLPGCARYTRSRQVVCLRALWRTDQRSSAAKLEYRIKQLPRAKKLALLASPGQWATFCGSILEPQQCTWQRGVTLEMCLQDAFCPQREQMEDV